MGTKASKIKPHKYALIGKRLDYSFSKNYFTDKFNKLKLDGFSYENLEFEKESDLAFFLLDKVFDYKGLNVTIPYKEIIIPYLDELTETAQKVQAVNTIVVKNGKLIGHNTDVVGFLKALRPLLDTKIPTKALIFGTGGASKAIVYALQELQIATQLISRKPTASTILSYQDITDELIKSHSLLINCTPVGTFPKINDCIDIPYESITKNHLVFDLIYNPKETLFLTKSKQKGATISNGYEMLVQQAENAWKIWTLA